MTQDDQRSTREQALEGRLDDARDVEAALRVLECFDEETEEAEFLLECLRHLSSIYVLDVVTSEMLGDCDDPLQLEATARFSELLLAAARRPTDIAVARWLCAVVAEREADPLAAEAQLNLALEADPAFEPAIDRRAWYLSDRGDAVGAVRLWRRLGYSSADNADLAEIEPFAAIAPAHIGRNDPCWCGSGRKFKVCHLRVPIMAPLPDRVGWLCRKATAFLERRGGAAAVQVFDVASARAGEGADAAAIVRAFDDPFVIDIALTELGWFERFLNERGPLLPDDEAILAASWVLVSHTVYEIASTEPGVGLVARDLRSGEEVQVRERTFSKAARVGTMVLGRAVPDGETHQFIGGLMAVAPGTETRLLDLLDRQDGFELASHMAALHRPPVMFTRENEPWLLCTAVIEVPDPAAAKKVLDVTYEPQDERWVELYELHPNEFIHRASISLEGKRITIETMSEPRIERVLSLLLAKLKGARLISDERRPFDPTAERVGGPQPMPMEDPPPEVQALLESMRDAHELRWIDEQIPALSGITPQEAAADPTRRESLVRLLASFEDSDEQRGGDWLGMRPSKLRELLGIEAP